MLRSSDDLGRMSIHATDGELGHIDEFYFDDSSWTIRYLVARTGSWLSGRTVLLTPAVISGVDWDTHRLSVSLTMDQVAEAPDVSTDRPVSRLQELEYLKYYDQPPYWMLGAEVGGSAIAIDAAMRAAAAEAEAAGSEPPTHLRSSREVRGYHLEASDGAIGHLRSYLIDDESWRVRYLVVDTATWWFGKDVVISPTWVSKVSWGGRCLHVPHSREEIKASPAYDPRGPMTREAAASLENRFKR
jgi:hypothetical protein